MNFKVFYSTFLSLIFFSLVNAQNLPIEVRITDQGRLVRGGNPTEGLYNPNDVHKLEITLSEPNWFQLMDGQQGPGSSEGQSLIGTLTFNDQIVLDSVLVSIKGQTSDFQNNSEKKSFKIEIDELKNQDLMGYDNLNLNGGYQDPSSMREVLYYDITRSFTPALKGAFIDLYINGDYWGPYSNVQQIEGNYIKEWFQDNQGTRWRAIYPDEFAPMGGGPGGGGMAAVFGTGVSTLNYNGADSTDYNENYTLKKTSKENPWEDLIEVCNKLNNESITDLYDELNEIFDIDRALWFLAQENVFADDDSYIHKGGMDYYVYWDNHTKRLMPLEVDGNTVLINNNHTWDPFYHSNDVDYPLLQRLLQNPEVRQRYLAHYRTILKNHFTEEDIHNRIDDFAEVLNARIINDPKKIFSHSQFLNGLAELKDKVSTRIELLNSNQEMDRLGVVISNLSMESPGGIGVAPQPSESATITVNVEGNPERVNLYFGIGLDGMFDRLDMNDDGTNGDQVANDNIFTGEIPGFSASNFVRYYVEAIKDDAYSTASYYPQGAEHDVFIYQVESTSIGSDDVVINEILASNSTGETDNNGEYDDWIEFYNNGNEEVDLAGFYLTDDVADLKKWTFPPNSSIGPDSYLIVWADNDEEQTADGELHANFKLSASGESVVLSNPNEEIVDEIDFDEQQENKGFARIPNGSGDFQIKAPTFNQNNENDTSIFETESKAVTVSIFPNPASSEIFILFENQQSNGNYELTISNSLGQHILNQKVSTFALPINIASLDSGLYFVLIYDLNHSTYYSQKLKVLR